MEDVSHNVVAFSPISDEDKCNNKETLSIPIRDMIHNYSVAEERMIEQVTKNPTSSQDDKS